jgi:uncharacterized protein (DUF362 family)
MNEYKVEIIQTGKKEYPNNPPFNPPEKYPEYPYKDIDKNNMVYKVIRDLLVKLELDREKIGAKDWNPLGDIIKPGDNVVIKPNFISEPRKKNVDPSSIVTHASVIRPIIDYCMIALKNKGSLTVADAPQTDSSFEKIKEITGIQDVIDFINSNSSLKVNLLDLREIGAQTKDGIIIKRFKLDGDPQGYTVVDLGEKSEFRHIEEYMDRIFGADYDFEEVRKHHNNGKHEYYISNTILNADVIINVPKLKTHKKAGITVCLKNLIGINGNKNYLPHYRFGSRKEGGDECLQNGFIQSLSSKFYQFIFKTMSRMGPTEMNLMRIPKKIYSFLSSKNITKHKAGDWYGNDTIWRTIVDLNKIFFYADKKGRIQEEVQRRQLSIVDGIIAGEGDGPHFPTARPCGIILGGFNPVLVDIIAAKIMGFDWKKIPQITEAKKVLFPNLSIDEIKIDFNLNFQPPPGWDYIVNDSYKH